MVSKEPDASASNEEPQKQKSEENYCKRRSSSETSHPSNNEAKDSASDVTGDDVTHDSAVPEASSEHTALSRTTSSAKRPTSLESQPDETPTRHKGLAKNGFDRLEIQKPKLTGKLSDSAIECASRPREKTPLREKLSDSIIHTSSRRNHRSQNSSSGEERDEISSLIGGASINRSNDSVFEDGIIERVERSPRRTHSHRKREGSHRSSPRSSDLRRSRRSIRTSSSGEHSRKPSVRRASTATPSHGQRKMSVALSERRESSTPQPYNAQQLDYLRRKSKKFHGPYMSPGLNMAHSYRNPGAEILMAVLIILVGFVALIVSYATGQKVWLIVGAVCCAIGGLFMLLGLCWYCATPQGKDPAYSIDAPGMSRTRGSHRESTRSRRSHTDEEDADQDRLLMEKLERRSAPASPIPV